VLLENRAKFLFVHCSSAHKGALREVLSSPEVASQVADTKAAKETKVMSTFFKLLQSDSGKATYGLRVRLYTPLCALVVNVPVPSSRNLYVYLSMYRAVEHPCTHSRITFC
jgi:hypothetical protein